ncbi:MAG: IclR family transcriptional regulator [Burkholderiaceae bacterium]|nr:IclR family transcriptional regulator [Burkholderiaceae bacterium]
MTAPQASDTAKTAARAHPKAGAPRLVPAVARATLLVDALAAAGRPLALADLARDLDLPKSSVHGLLGTLVALGLARRDGDGLFALGARPLQWADAFASQSGLLRAFERRAGEFAALRAETVMLAVLDGAEVAYLACRQGSRALAVNFRVGGRFPAAVTSSGKAMLASLPDARIRELLRDAGFARLTRHSVTSIPALLRQVEFVRANGYAIDDEETAQGMQCFGAPVFALGVAQAQAAVAVSVIKAGLTPRRRGEIVRDIVGLAASISTQLGGERS